MNNSRNHSFTKIKKDITYKILSNAAQLQVESRQKTKLAHKIAQEKVQ